MTRVVALSLFVVALSLACRGGNETAGSQEASSDTGTPLATCEAVKETMNRCVTNRYISKNTAGLPRQQWDESEVRSCVLALERTGRASAHSVELMSCTAKTECIVAIRCLHRTLSEIDRRM